MNGILSHHYLTGLEGVKIQFQSSQLSAFPSLTAFEKLTNFLVYIFYFFSFIDKFVKFFCLFLNIYELYRIQNKKELKTYRNRYCLFLHNELIIIYNQ